MRQLSTAGQQAIADIARRHGFSVEATHAMLDAVVRGNGTMAQFSHPEFGGAGQWMRGGMTMVGNMFDSQLKGWVDALCQDLANLVANQPEVSVPRTGAEPSPRGGAFSPSGMGDLFMPGARHADAWWPGEFGNPDASGSQNGIRYAYFAAPRRLVVERNGEATVHDTGDHAIGGVSQQQSGHGTLTFTSQHGPIDLASQEHRHRPAPGPAHRRRPAPPPRPVQRRTPKPFSVRSNGSPR